jgi:hypothetical protein
MDHQVVSSVRPGLNRKLVPGEFQAAEAGARSWMTEAIQRETATAAQPARGDGRRGEAGRRGVRLLHDRVYSPGPPQPKNADRERSNFVSGRLDNS